MAGPLKQQAVGDHVRRLRARQGLSLRDLAARTDFSASFISQVEHGQASPSISSMERIAHALGVTLGEFFAAAAPGRGGHVLKSSDRRMLASGWSHAVIESLHEAGEALEAVMITLEGGGRSGKHPYGHAAEEFGLVIAGQVRLTLGPEEYALTVGDTATILPGELRLWRNVGKRPARILLVSVRPSIGKSRLRAEPGERSQTAQQVLRALVLFDNRHPSSPLPLKRIATKALDGDAEAAAKVLQELDAAGLVRTDTMGWLAGWLTPLGRSGGK